MNALQLQPTDVVLVRHGETAWSLSGQHTGRTDIPLTPRGEAAAQRLAPLLATVPFATVLCSPLQRARRTAELAGFADRLVIESDLLEWNYGDYEGLTTAAIQASVPGWLVFREGCPGGESPAQVGERADRVIARLRGGPGPALLFAHGHLLRVLLARWIDLSPREGRRFLLDTATLNVLSHYRGTPALRCWNAPLPESPADPGLAGEAALAAG
jgi:probable phosphoglycerate mutase